MGIWTIELLYHFMEFLDLFSVTFLIDLLLGLHGFSWQIFSQVFFDDFICQALVHRVMSKLRKLVLELIDANFIGIQLIFKTRRGIVQFCLANHWLEIKFHRLRVHVLHLSTIKFLVVSLAGPHGSLRENDLWSRGVTLGRLIQIYLK